MADRNPADEAAAWWARLGHSSITNAEVRAFAAWRDDPVNDAAYSALEREGAPKAARFQVRPDREGYSVLDIWTGEPAVIAMTPQSELPEEDAHRTAELLNRRASQGDRSVPQ